MFGQAVRTFQAERTADAEVRRCEVGTRFRELYVICYGWNSRCERMLAEKIKVARTGPGHAGDFEFHPLDLHCLMW